MCELMDGQIVYGNWREVAAAFQLLGETNAPISEDDQAMWQLAIR